MLQGNTSVGTGTLAAIVYARREPDKVLLAILAVHLVVWTVLPILLCPNLQLDLVEDLALGKEWQLGYWKHPPLPWLIADLAYRVVGRVEVVYLLGPLSAVVCLYAVWCLARRLTGPLEALIAVLALEGVHFYQFSVVKFAHDQVQLPFWALTALFLYRALTEQRARDWMLSGAMLALCFWSKYAAFSLAASLGLFLLLDPDARRAWRTPGPWLMAVAFLIVIAPNAWWLVDSGFLPFRYVDARAKVAAHWWQFIVFPLQWMASQVLFLAPAIGLMALLYAGARRRAPPPGGSDERSAFARRYVTMLALGPFAVTTLIALLLGRLPVAMWGYPLWSFAPLALVLWLGPVDARRLRAFAVAFVAVFVAWPVIYAAVELGEPFLRDRPKATEFPGRQVAETVTRVFRDRFKTPLVYVGGDNFIANNVAVYSADRPHVVVSADPALSPWVDVAELRRRGGVLVWGEGEAETPPARFRAAFPDAEVQPPLTLPRQTRAKVRPVHVGYAIVPPRP
jgi:Dolichyl-phosphate-mannose-protein mannosyltransferase